MPSEQERLDGERAINNDRKVSEIDLAIALINLVEWCAKDIENPHSMPVIIWKAKELWNRWRYQNNVEDRRGVR